MNLMRAIALWLALLMLASCSNVSQMQRRYEAGDHSQLDRLMEIVARPDYPYATRRKAARALGEIADPRAVPVLSSALYDYDQRSTLKQEAVIALGRIGDRAAVEAIGRLLDRSLDPSGAEVRMTAVEALGKLGGAQAAEILVNALRYYDILTLRDEQRTYRGVFTGEEQTYPYGPYGRGNTDSTGWQDPGLRGPAMGIFPGEQPSISMFGTPINEGQLRYNPTPEERVLTHRALVDVGEDAVPVIEKFLGSTDTTHSLRQELLNILGEIRSPQAATADSSAVPGGQE